jgi:nucleoside-diphosphate-sugar epimerase
MIDRFAAALGRPLRIQHMPRPLLAIARRFVPILRELAEMGYQWDEPFVTDDRRFRKRFRPAVTSLDEGARATVEWAQRHYAAAAR